MHYEFDEEKSRKLRGERGLGFEDLATLMEAGCIVKSYDHPNTAEHPGQRIHAVNVEGYIWLVISERRGNNLRLVTCYQSRKVTRKWLKEFKNGKSE